MPEDGVPELNRAEASSHREVLLISFYFPPIQGSTGALRSVSLARHLPSFGWHPTVLTIVPEAYPRTDPANAALVPEWVPVVRTSAYDLSKVLGVRGRYPRVLALPDRWQTWFFSAVGAGLRLCRNRPPSVLFSTYPTPTAHLIGYALHRLTGIPWVAEFRDPMVEEGYPSTWFERRLRLWIDRRVARYAKRIVTVTDGAADLYRQRYHAAAVAVRVVENGYEDVALPAVPSPRGALADSERKVLLHSGVLYSAERDPRHFFQAIANLKARGVLKPDEVIFVFRGAGEEEYFSRLVASFGISDCVEFRPTIRYELAGAEMRDADALMVFQGRVCNRQIPAKVYEYLSLRRPILAFSDPLGDTGKLLIRFGVRHVAPLEDTSAIETAIASFMEALGAGQADQGTEPELLTGLSRRARAGEMAAVLDEALSDSATG